ncbi:MAG: hypothetical protein RLZZ338_1793 [Cyanobacteriota bacterium]|jgi:hypothetical protein
MISIDRPNCIVAWVRWRRWTILNFKDKSPPHPRLLLVIVVGKTVKKYWFNLPKLITVLPRLHANHNIVVFGF